MIQKETDTHLYLIKILDAHVIAVASINKHIGGWSAYIGSVKNDFIKEWMDVAENGSKLNKKIAEILFSEYTKSYTWRS